MPTNQLALVVGELLSQTAGLDDGTATPVQVELEQISEWIKSGELGIAYESIVCVLEDDELLTLSGRAAVALLEVGLTFGFKTERPQDSSFDTRHCGASRAE